jgi:hypothetical protein
VTVEVLTDDLWHVRRPVNDNEIVPVAARPSLAVCRPKQSGIGDEIVGS